MFSLQQYNTKPTRVYMTTKSCIDHIIASDEIVTKCNTFTGWSDHFAVVVELKLEAWKKVKNQEIEIRSMRNFNETDFVKDLAKVPWNVIDTFDDLDDKFSIFWTLFEDVLNIHAPKKIIKVKKKKQNKPWFNVDIDRLIKTRNMIRKEGNGGAVLKDLEKLIKRKISSAKSEYYINKIEENAENPKKLWNLLTEASNYKSSNSLESIIESNDMAQEFCDHLTNIPDRVNEQLQEKSNELNLSINESENSSGSVQGANFEFKAIDSEYVIKFFNKANSAKASGYDGVGMKFLKVAAPVIALPLTKLVNIMFDTGVFPKDLKKSKIALIHKGGDKSEKNNYRPISLLSAVSKLFERAIADQMTDHMENEHLFDDLQSAYRKRHSTSTALLHMVDSFAREMDNGNLVGVMAIDLSKAFDCLKHHRILSVLQHDLGFSDCSLKLIEGYLTDRKAFVQSGMFTSQEREIKHGIPQGSILGPILFISAISSLGDILKDVKYHAYADDVTIWVESNDPEYIRNKLETIAQTLFQYFGRMGMKINEGKCQYMILGSKRKLNNIRDRMNPLNVLGSSLFPKNKIKILGVTIDQNLKFDVHAKSVIAKCTGLTKFLWRTAKFLPLTSKKLLYNALVVPHLTYCDAVWSTTINKTIQKRLETIQNSGMRFILNINNRRHSSQDLRTELNWLPIHLKQKVTYNAIVWKALKCETPVYVQAMINTNDHHSHNTRPRLHVEARHTNVSNSAFSLKAPLLYNELPLCVRNSSSLSRFKKELFRNLKEC
jgi:hypothetical protein